MSKGFHHPGIALHTDCITNLPELMSKPAILKIMNVGKLNCNNNLFNVTIT